MFNEFWQIKNRSSKREYKYFKMNWNCTVQSGVSGREKGFVKCVLNVLLAFLGGMAGAVQPNGMRNSEKTVNKTFLTSNLKLPPQTVYVERSNLMCTTYCRAMHFLFTGMTIGAVWRGRLCFIAANFMVRKPIPSPERNNNAKVTPTFGANATKKVGSMRWFQGNGAR